MQKKSLYLGGLVLAISILVTGVIWITLQKEQPETVEEISLPASFESNGFRISFPEDWQHQIPQTNLFFLGSPEILLQEPGASMVVQRIVRMSGGADMLEDALTTYMDNGPLRFGTSWTVIEEISDTTLDGRDTKIVILEGADDVESDPLHSEIMMTRADNNIIYVLITTVPLEQRETFEPLLSAILDSFSILE